MSFNRVSQKGEGVAVLLAAGFHHCQHRLDEAAGGKGELSPLGTPPPQTCTDRRENHNAQPLVNNSGSHIYPRILSNILNSIPLLPFSKSLYS